MNNPGRKAITILTLLVALSACGVEAEPETPRSSSLSVRTVGAVIHFDESFEQGVDGVLVSGDTVRVRYDLQRLPQCFSSTAAPSRDGRRVVVGVGVGVGAEGEASGSSWDTTAFVRFLPSREVAQRSVRYERNAPFRLPAGTEAIEVWCRSAGEDCGEHWDSNYGANYRFEVAPVVAAIRFDADWSVDVEGPLVPGGALSVDYDLARLPQCAGDSYMGQATWNTWAYGRFLPGGQTFESSVVRCLDRRCESFEDVEVAVIIPDDARAVELWFNTAGRACGSHWDSNFGNNHRLSIDHDNR